MVNNPGNHEQRRFKGGVVDNMENGCSHGQRRTNPEQADNQAQMADGGIGQQTFQIFFENGKESRDTQGKQTNKGDQIMVQRCAGKNWQQTCQQENPGFHHGRGVQIGRYRRWCRHGIRQPEMERELGTFGKGAE